MALREKRGVAWTAGRCSGRRPQLVTAIETPIEEGGRHRPCRTKIPAPMIATPIDILFYWYKMILKMLEAGAVGRLR